MGTTCPKYTMSVGIVIEYGRIFFQESLMTVGLSMRISLEKGRIEFRIQTSCDTTQSVRVSPNPFAPFTRTSKIYFIDPKCVSQEEGREGSNNTEHCRA